MTTSRGVVLALILLPFPVLAQDLFVYPAKGQSAEQTEQDKFQCYNWAKQNSGFDPMQQPTASSPPPPQEAPQGGVGLGAVRGAGIGLVGGAIAGDAAKGAAIGAATGGIVGGLRRRDQQSRQQQQQQQWEQQQVAEYQANRTNYNRAYKACLEGRGYTVN